MVICVIFGSFGYLCLSEFSDLWILDGSWWVPFSNLFFVFVLFYPLLIQCTGVLCYICGTSFLLSLIIIKCVKFFCPSNEISRWHIRSWIPVQVLFCYENSVRFTGVFLAEIKSSCCFLHDWFLPFFWVFFKVLRAQYLMHALELFLEESI